jgi:hypothetical protein
MYLDEKIKEYEIGGGRDIWNKAEMRNSTRFQ